MTESILQWGQHEKDGFRYPVRAKEIRAALEKHGCEKIEAVRFLRNSRSIGTEIASAYLTPEGLDNPRLGKVTVTVYAVPSEDTEIARDSLLDTYLDEIARWARAAELAPETWRTMRHAILIELHKDKSVATRLTQPKRFYDLDGPPDEWPPS